MKLNQKLNYTLYIFLFSIFLFSCKEYTYDNRSKVVLSKTIDGEGEYLVAFTDGGQDTFDFTSYSMIEVGDTLVFKCVKDLSFNFYNCNFIEIKR
mgnify:CR=1 FL=1|jgi:hypothetical protein|tara:strand:- start:41766 stop:42050 length:285 start_codon:yes stop_codon:yes gene_type:complete